MDEQAAESPTPTKVTAFGIQNARPFTDLPPGQLVAGRIGKHPFIGLSGGDDQGAMFVVFNNGEGGMQVVDRDAIDPPDPIEAELVIEPIEAKDAFHLAEAGRGDPALLVSEDGRFGLSIPFKRYGQTARINVDLATGLLFKAKRVLSLTGVKLSLRQEGRKDLMEIARIGG